MRVAVDYKITELFSRDLIIFVLMFCNYFYPPDVSFPNFRNECLSRNNFTVFCIHFFTHTLYVFTPLVLIAIFTPLAREITKDNATGHIDIITLSSFA